MIAAPFSNLFVIGCVFYMAIAMVSCSTSNDKKETPPVNPTPTPKPKADSANAVPQDGVLEAVTWNLEWFGYTNYGPSNESLQANNDIKVVDSLNADLFAFEEVKDAKTIQQFAGRMQGYRVVFDKTTNQGNAFVYNTNAIDSVSSGDITTGQTDHAWAGRVPFYFSFNYKPGADRSPIEVYAVVIHAKAGAGKEDYNRRTQAAQQLYDYLSNEKPDACIILLGDFNDETTKSIHDGLASPYAPFVNDSTHYTTLTYDLSAHHKTSETDYSSVIDNIVISNEMDGYYQSGSTLVFIPTDAFIKDYKSTTSDHYPVMAKFDMRR